MREITGLISSNSHYSLSWKIAATLLSHGKVSEGPPGSPKNPCRYLVINELCRLLFCQLFHQVHTLSSCVTDYDKHMTVFKFCYSISSRRGSVPDQLAVERFLKKKKKKYTATSSLSASVSLEGRGVIMSLMDNWQHSLHNIPLAQFLFLLQAEPPFQTSTMRAL